MTPYGFDQAPQPEYTLIIIGTLIYLGIFIAIFRKQAKESRPIKAVFIALSCASFASFSVSILGYISRYFVFGEPYGLFVFTMIFDAVAVLLTGAAALVTRMKARRR